MPMKLAPGCRVCPRPARLATLPVALLLATFTLFPACTTPDLEPGDDDDASVGDDDDDDVTPTPSPSPTPGPQDADQDGHFTPDDCDDSNPAINPDAEEVCNRVDDDCDDRIDEILDLYTWYPDGDGDGYGGDGATVEDCGQPQGYAAAGGDCNDADATIHPNSEETCNSRDEDCDGQVDEGVLLELYPDGDGDGFGSSSAEPQTACASTGGLVAYGGDCDDANGVSHPVLVSLERGTGSGDGSPAQPFASIQAAVNQLGECQVVLVDPGVYQESVIIADEQDVRLESTRGPEFTQVTVGFGQRALTIQNSSSITVSGLAFSAIDAVNGPGAAVLVIGSSSVSFDTVEVTGSEAAGGEMVGGGLAFVSSQDGKVTRSVFRGNSADFGGALGFDDATGSVSDSLFEDNVADTVGGALVVGNLVSSAVAQVSIDRCTVRNNTAGYAGGGIYADYRDDVQHLVSIRDTRLEGNAADGLASLGGALFNPRQVLRSVLLENDAVYGGAMFLPSDTSVANSFFWGNYADGAGASIAINATGYDAESVIDVSNNTLVDNEVASKWGTALYVYDVNKLTLRNNIMIDLQSEGTLFYNLELVESVFTIENNLWYAPDGTIADGFLYDSRKLIGHDGNISGDPRFVRYVAEDFDGSDLHLGVDSPCVNKGTSAVGSDLDGSAPDIGAYGGPQAGE